MAKGLGRGLAALISDKNLHKSRIANNVSDIETNFISSNNTDEVHGSLSNKQLTINVKDIIPGRFQPRINFNEYDLDNLAESIRANGIIQPIVVRLSPDSNVYEIIAGERRWRASAIAGISQIPAVIMDIDDKKAMEIGLVENIQRQNLNILEEAAGYKRLIDEFEYTQEDLGRVIGKSRSNIANTMRLLALPDNIKDHLISETITAGHARALLVLDNPDEAVQLIISKGLNVRQTETLVKKLSEKPSVASKKAAKNLKPPEIIQLERELSAKIGMDVSITAGKESGHVTIAYKNISELDTLLNILEKAS